MLLAWVMTPGTDDDTIRHLDVLEEMVFVLVARVGAFEAELPGFYLEDIADDVRKRGLVNPRAFIDAIAGVEADLFWPDAFDRGIRRLGIDLGLALHLLLVEMRVDEEVGQEGIVDLNDEARFGDGAVFLAELDGESMEEFLVGLVIFVAADTRWRGRRQEDMVMRHAGHLGGGFHIGDIGAEQRFAFVFHGADTDHRHHGHGGAAEHRGLEILFVIFGESGDFFLEHREALIARLEAVEPRLDVGEESRLRELAIGDVIDAASRLLADRSLAPPGRGRCRNLRSS